MSNYLTRPLHGTRSQSPPPPWSDPGFLLEYPALSEYLSVTEWEEGKPRETSTLLLFVEDGRWVVCLNDRAEGRSVFVSGPTFKAVLASLEEGLQEGSLQWRNKTQNGLKHRGK